MSEIATFIIHRGQLKGQLKHFIKYINDNKNIDIEQLRLRKGKVKRICNDYERVQIQIDRRKMSYKREWSL